MLDAQSDDRSETKLSETKPDTDKFSSARYGSKRPLRFLKKRLEYQREAPLGTPFLHRLEMWRKGYRDASYQLYDFRGGAGTYLPDTARLETFFINGSFAHGVLKDKLLFSKLLGAQLPVPETVGFVERGVFYAGGVQGEGEQREREQGEELLATLEARGSLVLKPSDGTRGRGVYRLETDPLRLNGAPTTADEVAQRVKALDDVLVTEAAQQASYAQAIFPGSTNTVRVMTMIDPASAEPFVARAVHRFGARGTEPIDNWSRGGLCAPVDLASGRLGAGVKHTKRTGGKLEWRTHHPDTDEAVEGVMIPRWAEVCEALLSAVRALPFLVYVGWDVVVTETGFCVLEGNANPDLDLLQVHGGLLSDPGVRRFYEHHKVV